MYCAGTCDLLGGDLTNHRAEADSQAKENAASQAKLGASTEKYAKTKRRTRPSRNGKDSPVSIVQEEGVNHLKMGTIQERGN